MAVGTSSRIIKRDLWGYAVHTSSDECISHLNTYYVEVLCYGGGKRAILNAAEADRQCALACGLAAAYLWARHNSKMAAPEITTYLEAAKRNLARATGYETLVVRALITWMEESTGDALSLHFEILKRYPKDLVALKRAQTLSFTMGCSNTMLTLALKALPFNLGNAYMLGMLAFALVEVGCIKQAEDFARIALNIEARDVWAQHALVHALEYQCRFKEAVMVMNQRCKLWSSCCAFMRGHNWWHMATCYLESGGPCALYEVFHLYDEFIWGTKSRKINTQIYLNALGLLLRVETYFRNNVVDDRLQEVVLSLEEAACQHENLFVNLLSIWALGRADRQSKASDIVNSLKRRVLALDGHEVKSLQRVASLASALYEYGRGNFAAVAETLGPSFSVSALKVLGASNEQLEVFQDVWLLSSLNAGSVENVAEVTEMLLRERPGVLFRWRILEQAYTKLGRSSEAASAAEKALALESAAYIDLKHHGALTIAGTLEL